MSPPHLPSLHTRLAPPPLRWDGFKAPLPPVGERKRYSRRRWRKERSGHGGGADRRTLTAAAGTGAGTAVWFSR
ncbi:hypothetical protein EYF80_042138 [Liparis tanakae]|uniref:Uncharacterized protein n=1 Tax=Liparis tanakae TaxID=230148 RepID=A0A4Z2G265_9TELE|nr:hypothetical protein EYF80_042138 [Liparis tanakae]